MNHDSICKHTPFPEKTALLRSMNAALNSDAKLGISRLTGQCYNCKKLIYISRSYFLVVACIRTLFYIGPWLYRLTLMSTWKMGSVLLHPIFLVIMLSTVALARFVERMVLGIVQWHPITIADRLVAGQALEKIRCENLLIDVYVYGGSVFSAYAIVSLLCS